MEVCSRKICTTATSLFLSGINWRIYQQQVKRSESSKDMILEGGLQKKAVKKYQASMGFKPVPLKYQPVPKC